MVKGKIREILNKIKWTDQSNYSNYIITFIHRGAVNDQKEISFDKVIDITPSFFVYINEILEETYIPFHRILKITNIKDNQVLWVKK